MSVVAVDQVALYVAVDLVVGAWGLLGAVIAVALLDSHGSAGA